MKKTSTLHQRPLLLTALMAVSALVLTAVIARAAANDSWIIPIGSLQGSGFTTYTGAGYGGTDAYGANTIDGTRRVYWKLDPSLLSVGTGNPMPAGMNQYTISFYRPTAGNADWQPIESQIGGAAGEVYPNDPMIPWAGMWGTSHQYIGAEQGTPGTWKTTGPGPHTPESADYNAGANGIYMWLNVGTTADNSSWLYAKWDYGWAIDHTWSAIMVTIPEPSALALGLLGGFALLTAYRRNKH